MSTSVIDPENKSRESFLGVLLGLTLLWAGSSAFLRILGAQNYNYILEGYGVPIWKTSWLLASSAILLLVNFFALFFLWKGWPLYPGIAWAAFLLNVGFYWFERLFVWTPDQRFGGNIAFVILLHGLYLFMMLGISYSLKKGKAGNG